MLTAETITEADIVALRKWASGCLFTEAGSISQLCGYALGVLSPEAPGARPRHAARARCAEIINERANRTQ